MNSIWQRSITLRGLGSLGRVVGRLAGRVRTTSTRQRVAGFFAALTVAAFLCPPWALRYRVDAPVVQVRYGPMWAPPHPGNLRVARVDAGLLGLELVAIAMIGAFALVAVRKP
jgi:hypothetical protein